MAELSLSLTSGRITLAELRKVYAEATQLNLPAGANGDIEAGARCVNRLLEEDRTTYGVSTGFGLLAQTRTPKDQLEDLQRSLVLCKRSINPILSADSPSRQSVTCSFQRADYDDEEGAVLVRASGGHFCREYDDQGLC